MINTIEDQSPPKERAPEYKILALNNYFPHTEKLEDLLNSGWKIARVDSPHIAYGGNCDAFWKMIYVLYK